jgi:ribose 5-phosphate isomerase B
MGRQLITERDILEAVKHGIATLAIEPNSIITAAAKDEAKKRNIQFVNQKRVEATLKPIEVNSSETGKQNFDKNVMIIAIGSDHGGFPMKESIKVYLSERGHTVVDMGTDSEKACDYPDFAYAVAKSVVMGKAERGIMVDAVGIASAIAANKVTGIRAVSCNNEFLARSSREHNNANVLTLGGRVMGIELAKSIVKIWLETPYSGGRHQARVDKISDIENRLLKPSQH